MAPEIFRIYEQDTEDFSYSNKCDIWSLGTVLYEMLLGHNLTKIIKFSKKTEKISQLKEFLLKKEDIQIQNNYGLSKLAINLLSQMLRKDPYKRININQVLSHPWMKNESEDGNHKTLLISFFLVDDLQQKGKLTRVFFSLRQTKVNVCKIFINQLMTEMIELYYKLEKLLRKTIDLEKKLET